MMPRAVTVGIDPGTFDVVSSVAAECGLAVEVKPNEASDWTLDQADEIAVFVIGDVPEPMRIIRRCHVAAPNVPVLIVTSKESCQAIKEAMRFSPLVSREVRCVDRSDREHIRAGIRTSVERRRHRAAMQQTIGALNRRIDQATAPARNAVALLGRLLEIAPIGVAITDGEAVVCEVNPRAAQLLIGGDASMLVGRPIWNLFPERERARLQALLDRLNGDPNNQPREAFASETEDHRFQVELTGAMLTTAAGGPGYLVLIEDTTERQTLIEQLQAANRRKDEFLAMLGHELRNPLAPIQTAVDLIRTRGSVATERELAIIERQLNHVVRLVDDLLDVARITRGKLELRCRPIELATAVAHAIEMASPLLEHHGHTLHIEVAPDGLMVDADPPRLAQIVANLLTNAAKYTSPGGRITVVAERELDRIVLRVADTGRGIAAEILPHVFELFLQETQRIDRAAGGLGIGLAIVRSLVELHGGEVSVTSELGSGSEFVIRLPAAKQHSKPPPQRSPDSPAEQPAGAEVRVLVVDDNEDGAIMLADLLTTLGFVTQIALDGPAALQVAQTFTPDIVLLDIGLPVMDGYEVAERLRSLPGFADVGLIAITGYGQAEDRARTRAAGLDDHLVKPITLSAVRDAIARVLAES